MQRTPVCVLQQNIPIQRLYKTRQRPLKQEVSTELPLEMQQIYQWWPDYIAYDKFGHAWWHLKYNW